MKYAYGAQREQTDYKSEKVRPLGKPCSPLGSCCSNSAMHFSSGYSGGLGEFPQELGIFIPWPSLPAAFVSLCIFTVTSLSLYATWYNGIYIYIYIYIERERERERERQRDRDRERDRERDWGLPGGSAIEFTFNVGATGVVDLTPRLERSPGGGHGNPLQYSCRENPMDRGAWWATVHGVTKSRTWLKLLSTAQRERVARTN